MKNGKSWNNFSNDKRSIEIQTKVLNKCAGDHIDIIND